MAAGRAIPAPVTKGTDPATPGKTTPEDFMEFVIGYFKLSPDVFRDKRSSRKPYFVNVKHMVRHYLYRHYDLSNREVGVLTCNADHSTVLHSREKHEEYLVVDFEYRKLNEAFQTKARELGFYTKEGWRRV